MRIVDSRVLKKSARAKEPARRRDALRAMGRIQSKKYLRPLRRALKDRDPAVRYEAIFALGQLGLSDVMSVSEREAASDSLWVSFARGKIRGEPGRNTSLAAVEAMGKIGGAGTEGRLLSLLELGEPRVSGEAALGIFRLRYNKHIPEYSSATVAGLSREVEKGDGETRWRAAYALSRWPEPRVTGVLEKSLRDGDRLTKVFSLRALGRLKTDAPVKTLAGALADPDFWVRTEAVRALGKAKRADLLGKKIYADPSAHVRAAAADALARSEKPSLSPRLDGLLSDSSVLVRGQAFLALAKLRKGDAMEILDRERKRAGAPSWLVAQAYRAMAGLPGSAEALKEGIESRDIMVASEALGALAKSTETFVLGILDEVLRDPKSEMEMRGTAAEAAGEKKSLALMDALHAALKHSHGRGLSEIRDSIEGALKAIAKEHPQYRKKYAFASGPVKLKPSRFVGRKTEPFSIVFETSKGEIEIAVAVDEAPIHAASLLESVKGGVYKGTTWHRVVSGFVIQGGDPRGTGWGDAGFTLRDEINPLRYERGVVGMPKAGKDTGGSQIFIMHLPAPSLDGRYTVFGRVTRGMDVVDRIEPGDRILSARVR